MKIVVPVRKHLQRREVPHDVRFLTFSCQRRLPLLSNALICELVLGAMAKVRERNGLQIFAWVLMPEHVHLLARPADGSTIDLALRAIKVSVAKRAIERWKELQAPILSKIADTNGSPRFWQPGGGFDRNVRDESELSRTVKYIHLNPVEARSLVTKPEDWRWSSVRWWMGKRDGESVCDEPPGHWEGWKGFA